MVKTILCHVSDEKYDILTPQPPENAICLSENKFISYFGQYLYLFDLDKLRQNFYLERLPTTGLYMSTYVNPELINGIDRIFFKSQDLGYEWRCYKSIDVNKYCIGIIEHWNHMKGIIGKRGIDGAIQEIAIDLMRYKGELRE